MKAKVFFILAGLVIIYYFRSPFGYFQSDEWIFFSIFLPFTQDPLGLFHVLGSTIFETLRLSGAGHLQPFYDFLWFLQNQFFGLSYLPYSMMSIAVHILNAYLIYETILCVVQKKRIAILGGIFFATLATHQEAVTWVNAIPSELAVTGGVLSVLLLLKGKRIIWSALSLAIALLFKETAIVLFPVLLLVSRVLHKKFARHYVFIAVLYGSIRLLLLFVFPQVRPILPASAAVWPPLSFPLFLFRSVTVPLKMLVEVFVPSSWIVSLSGSFDRDTVIYVLGVVMLLIGIWLMINLRKQKLTREMYCLGIGLTIVLMSAFPVIFIALYSPRFGYETFIESRHLYFPAVGAAFIFPVVLDYLFKNRRMALAVLVLWSGVQFADLQRQLVTITQTGIMRQRIVDHIMKTIAVNERKITVLFISNREYYGYGFIPPFKTNLAQILAVHLFARHHVPFMFSTTDYWTKRGVLWQGYMTQGEYSLGYYYQKQLLMDAVKRGEVPVESIHAFSWDGTTNTLTNILW